MGQRRLTLMRHGEAQPIDSVPEDFERTLTRHGIHEAREMAARLAQRGLMPDLILASPAERAWATAVLLAAACELDPRQLQGARELYLATPDTTWRLVTQADASVRHLLVCGHNPGLSQIAGRLGPRPQTRELATAGLATAVWHNALWTTLEPETADHCALDDPERLGDDWQDA